MNDVPAAQIAAMLAVIERDARLFAADIGTDRFAPQTLAAIRAVPRHRFVPPHLQSAAYADGALPIGHGQTISQPFIVALMTDLLALHRDEKVLEIGTGSGYQTAVLAHLAGQVYSMEILCELQHAVAARLSGLGLDNVALRCGDGYQGWPEQAPFDAIVVTAAAPHVPAPLVAQLRPGGRLVIPVGPAWGPQRLIAGTRQADGNLAMRKVLDVAFVPLTGEHAAAC